MSDPIRVFIADDHPVVRRGIRSLLETETGLQVVGEAADGLAAAEAVQALRPDVVLMDLVMPVLDGIQATQRISECCPGVRVLVLTSFATDDKVFPAIKAGALGYLIKDSPPEELVRAIRQVQRGEPSLHPDIAQRLLQEISQTKQAAPQVAVQKPQVDPLTSRELEVLKLLANGLNNQEIAEALVISVATVYTHVSNILSKLHLASRTQAALYALREGLASLEDLKPGE